MRKTRGEKGRRLFGLLLSLVLLAGTLLIALLGNLSSTLADPSGPTDISEAVADESAAGSPMEFPDTMDTEEIEGIWEFEEAPQPAPAPVPAAAGLTHTIDVNNGDGSLTATGRGYTFNMSTFTLSFDASAAGNDYTILRTQAGTGAVKGIAFVTGGSPASVSFNNLVYLSGGITLPGDFQADLTFNDVDLVTTTLMLPTGYRGNLDFHGLDVATLQFPSDYPGPITFNGLTVSAALTYPTNYNGPITIGGSFNVKGNQFPASYTGPITIGDSGGSFGIVNTICRAGASIGFDTGIFIPNNIATLTINNAKTSGNGSLNMKLGSADNFELLLAGSSDIKGYIEVPTNATLAIDSKAAPNTGSESGRLAITSNTNTAVGGSGAADNGAININGGTVEATGQMAGIGGGRGQITINGGKTVATCTGSGAGIGSCSNSSIETVAHITINGGTVIASAQGDGAGIGSGSGATGGFPNNTTSVGAVIQINGGTVVANGGDVERIYLGSGAYSGAGIGGGKDACADITITAGHITANSMHGAGIGNGQGGSVSNARGSVVITGGTIRGYSMDGANIGKGNGVNDWRPTYSISKEADILMHRRGYYNDDGSLVGWCGKPNGNVGANGYNGDSHGDGYLVNLFWLDVVYGDLYVYEAGTSAFVRRLPIPEDHNYGAVLFSTGHSYPEDFRIFVDRLDHNGKSVGMKQVVHYYDHLPPLPGPSILQLKHNIIPSITHMESYPHNFDTATWHTLFVAFDDGQGSPDTYRITEKFVDINGKPLPGISGKEYYFDGGASYSKTIPEIPDYNGIGHKWGDTPPSGVGTFTPGDPPTTTINENKTIYFVYKGAITITEKYVDANGASLGMADTQTIVEDGDTYSKAFPPINGYMDLGYKWHSPPADAEDCEPGRPTDLEVTEDAVIYLVYIAAPPLTGIGLGNTGAMLLLPALVALLALGGYAARTVYRRRGKKAR